MSRFLT
jgi:hypothetical protein